MTREEAIIVLRSYRIPQNEEAIDMAISALQENPKLIKEAERWQAYFEDEVANEW